MSTGCTQLNPCVVYLSITGVTLPFMNTVKLPWPPKELSPNSNLHWAKKAKKKKEYRTTCWALALESKLKAPEGDGRINMEITFYPPDKRHRDADNMVASMKSGLDGLADALRVNDKRFLPNFKFTDTVMGMVVIEIK
jgi:crossover junction endodeoxyribonuclease RusA